MQESGSKYAWDFFLSHSSADTDNAKVLYNVLNPPAKVFLDAFSLVPGDNFDVSLPEALQGSLISVILISPNTEQAYYEKEEIAMAIQIARADPDTRRVVPVYMNMTEAKLPAKAPFGLTRKHSLYIYNPDDFTDTGKKL